MIRFGEIIIFNRNISILDYNFIKKNINQYLKQCYFLFENIFKSIIYFNIPTPVQYLELNAFTCL